MHGGKENAASKILRRRRRAENVFSGARLTAAAKLRPAESETRWIEAFLSFSEVCVGKRVP